MNDRMNYNYHNEYTSDNNLQGYQAPFVTDITAGSGYTQSRIGNILLVFMIMN